MNFFLSRLLFFLLLPFSWMYLCITNLRNYLYDKGLLKSWLAPVAVISMGNLSAGGTGKTPHTEYLLHFLKATFPERHVAVLSRGYGRQTKGFLLADERTTAATLGDEPMQFFRKFGKKVKIAVCEKRPLGIQKLLLLFPNLGVVVLDDAFQHRPLKPGLNILLTDVNRLFSDDYALPSGRLRESRTGAKRADCVLITKVPDEQMKQTDHYRAALLPYLRPGTPVFFTGIRYSIPVGFRESDVFSQKLKRVLLVSGIARPEAFEKQACGQFELAKHLVYADHHFYSQEDISEITTAFLETGASFVLTTEKDFVKLLSLRLPEHIPFFYLPVAVFFHQEEDKFQSLIRDYLK